MINSDYLKNLNKAQKEAVLHLDGPLLIVAGAGSGKTKVLTSRIAHIIKEKKHFLIKF
jgi:DNA helicase-2/ATP-dependent DNA helicase PcrA